jgi:hypothetical protein
MWGLGCYPNATLILKLQAIENTTIFFSTEIPFFTPLCKTRITPKKEALGKQAQGF